MSQIRTKPEQTRESIFKADYHISVYFETSKFDNVVHVDKGRIIQKMGNLGEFCRHDIRIMKKVLKKFKFTKEKNIISLENSPSVTEVRDAIVNLKKRCREKPERRFVIFAVLSGHGIIDQGV